ncbi:MAG: HNH endonuclease [Methylococcales bacterium]|nr:HNH endonuclease [Methylococcales bacterium]MDP3840854.1 HNH endonuclease [Methylococcales bacterium]
MTTDFLIISIEIIIFLSGSTGLWFYQKRIISNNTKQHESYPDYLNSKKWDDLKKIALERADYQCELCDAPYNHVHHVKYPKRYKEDHVDNLVVVCEKCHARLHGIRENKKIEDKILYSDSIKVGNYEYFFSVTQSGNGSKCLHIVRKSKTGEQRIEVMESNIDRFASIINAGCTSLSSNEPFQFGAKAGDLPYSFEIKVAKNENKYLEVTELTKEKANKITIFENEAKFFSNGLDKARVF